MNENMLERVINYSREIHMMITSNLTLKDECRLWMVLKLDPYGMRDLLEKIIYQLRDGLRLSTYFHQTCRNFNRRDSLLMLNLVQEFKIVQYISFQAVMMMSMSELETMKMVKRRGVSDYYSYQVGRKLGDTEKLNIFFRLRENNFGDHYSLNAAENLNSLKADWILILKDGGFSDYYSYRISGNSDKLEKIYHAIRLLDRGMSERMIHSKLFPVK